MILEHESCGSMMDALTRPKHAGGESEEEEKKDEHDFGNDNNNGTASVPSTPSRTSCSSGHHHALVQATPRETNTPTSTRINSNNTSYDTTTIKHSPPPTPFFIMDWLKEVNPEDLELARKLLQTPNKHNDQQHPHRQHASMGALGAGSKQEEEDDSIKKDLFATSPHRCASTGQLHLPKTSSSSVASSMSLSSFHRRSIMIGNGWNAKGLQKAQLGRWQDALACWENALEIRRQVLGEEHVDVANTHNNIGIALGKLNRPEEAISSLHMALEIRTMMMEQQQQHDDDDDDDDDSSRQHCVQQVAATLHNLANVHQQAGDLKMAIAYLEESIDLLKQQGQMSPLMDGDDDEQHASVHVARAHVAIGHVHYEAQELDKAQQSYQQGLEILQRCDIDQYCEAEIESIRTDLDEIDRRVAPL